MFLRNVGCNSTDYTESSQKMILFITTAVKTSNSNRRIVGHVFNMVRVVSRKVGD
jgi:hypothetical protein